MKCCILLFLIYSIMGSLLHFTFNWSNRSVIVGIFSAINESVWEHIKLLLTPIFFCSFISFLLNIENNFFIVFVELVLSIVLIILFYEIKQNVFKDKFNLFYILSFYITCFIVSFANCYLKRFNIPTIVNSVSLLLVLLIFAMYLTFSIFPPKNKYFKDPITGKYGIDSCVNKSV